jgi:hypothetical protein
MSIPDPRFQNCAALDPQELTAMNRAYDLACQTLQNIGQLEVDREIIARGTCGLRKAASATPINCASALSKD